MPAQQAGAAARATLCYKLFFTIIIDSNWLKMRTLFFNKFENINEKRFFDIRVMITS